MNRFLSPAVRRLVLGGALLLGTLVALLPELPASGVAEAMASGPLHLAQSDARSAAEAARSAAREAADAAREAAREARRKAAEADAEAGKEERSVHRRGLRLDLSDHDREYDSFQQFLGNDTVLAGGVLGIVFIVFLTPILFVGLIIWYKLRKNRMQNETMVRLAEKGLIPPGEAMQAIGTGQAGQAVSLAAATAPLTEQARALRKAAAWSDLRKGIIMGSIGLALTLAGMIDDGTANWLGLVLMFVGVGFVVLWYFEDQHAGTAAAAASNPVPPPGPGAPSN